MLPCISLLKRNDRIAKPAQIASKRHKDTKYSKSKFVEFIFFNISLELAIFFTTYFSHTNPINCTRRSQYRLLTERSISEFGLPVQKSVEKSKDTGEGKIEGQALLVLAKVLYILGKPSETYQKAERALKISKQIRDRKMEAEALYTLGLALYDLSKPRESLLKLEEPLKISEEIGDHTSRVKTLNTVGAISR